MVDTVILNLLKLIQYTTVRVNTTVKKHDKRRVRVCLGGRVPMHSITSTEKMN